MNEKCISWVLSEREENELAYFHRYVIFCSDE